MFQVNSKMNADQINEFGFDTYQIFRILRQMFTKKRPLES